MKKPLKYRQVLLWTMRITATQLFFALILFGAAYAHDGSAQSLLSQKVSVSATGSEVKKVLNQMEKQADVRFVFSSKLIKSTRKVTVTVQNKPLSEALDDILTPLGLQYEVSGKIIILKRLITLPEQTPSASAPKKNISGKVLDEVGLVLPGVSVVIKGTQTGTNTNAEGDFQLDIPEGALGQTVLVFSFVGYKTQEEIIGNQTALSIKMTPEDRSLKEVVVVGYGTVKKKDLTGAVSTVQGDMIANRKTTQISQALQGSMPGVMVTRSNSAPGATASIRVRGVTTINDAGANPLIILDGVPVDDINSINPNDVDNISVLKDAASASIYGSRAAAGVILVTTKRAKDGQLNLDYTFEYGIEKATRLPTYVGAQRYMQLTNELRWNDNGNGANQYPAFAKDLIDNYPQLHQENPDQYPDTDWRKMILNNSAPRRSHILSISGAGKTLRSRVSFGYDKSDGLYDGRSYERITARVNNDITINKYLSATVDMNFRRAFSTQPVSDVRTPNAMTYPIVRMGMMPAIFAAEWSDGRVGAGKDGANIYALIKNGGFNNLWSNQIGGKMSLDFTPVDGLKLSGVVSPFLNFDKGKIFTKKVPYTSYNNPGSISGYIEGATETKLQEARNDNYRYTTQFLANYSKEFGNHSVSILGGYEFYKASDELLGASRGQYQLTSYPYLNLGPLEFRDNSGSAFESAYRSYFGRVMYNFKGKYLLQANIRYDASSRFASDYRWGAFPSVSAGWTVSDEKFMESTASWLSLFKVRASWGSLGNERIADSYYPYQALLNFETSALFYQGNNVVSAQSAEQAQYAIRDISWETTQSYDIGVDMNFFRDRLRFTGDYYRKTTKDMLLPLEIPDYIGFENPNQNTGKMFTNGWEAQLGWNDKAGAFRYSASFNLSDFKSKMGNLGGTQFLADQVKFQGSEFNEWYGYVSEGLYQTADEVANSAKLNANMKPGDIRYKDISGPNGVPDGKISPEYDRVLLGGSLPRLMFGANFQLGYGNWDFSFVVQGVAKQNSRLGPDILQPYRQNFGNFQTIIDGKSWSNYNTAEQNLAAQYPRYSNTSATNNYVMSDYWMINGGYLRLKNISLGYNVPKTLTDKIHISGVRLYGTVTDLFSLDRFPKGWDPEQNALAYPITTSFVFGASVKF
ncbi:TonB-dependent receptor [Dyadobacter psychrotolerans]|uniref:SusC/RagA family TonB-linked outer membrane protein n=1 Tax=Dyadobacter psychrotolerans TaxID=2541721 RepID=A0A4R5E0A7_9BACT|nr:TonB-dependent receptor [Dyadobacter psychrotolerans]TDE17175.1 SusC/RagA family TonB-linked outer membrane protein [Dyadobacter psychrotolerans]